MLCFVRLHRVKLGPPAVQNLVETGSCVLMARRRRRCCCCCVCRGRLLLKQQQSATTGLQAAVTTASAQRHVHIWNIWHINTEKKLFTCSEIVLSCPNRIGFPFYISFYPKQSNRVKKVLYRTSLHIMAVHVRRALDLGSIP